MNPTELFIRRPVATTLLTLGLVLAGATALFHLPVAPLPQVDFPTILVDAQMPGASPEVMAATVATPLERHLGIIADVTEMTSQSTVGSTRIVLQFGLDRDIDGAARDVQAAINAARADLPASLRNNPTYRKANPADAPILILALSSKTLTRGQLYDAATTVLQQKLSQLAGIGEVRIGGSSLPAVRAELNPRALFKYGIGLEDVRAALSAANAHSPKGAIEAGERRYQIYTNDQARRASQFRSLLIGYRNGAMVRLSDVAEVSDSVENLRNAGLANGTPAVLVILFKQPGANIIKAIDGVMAALPQLKASVASDIDITVANDRSTTIRASLHDLEWTLALSIGLVLLAVFAFLRDGRTALIPSVVVPVSLIGTFGAMYLLRFSIDNLSLMAITVATGFVVDDAIVVVENVSRHVEAGMPRMQAAIKGAGEVGFTVLSMSLSLVAVFLPILLMGGIVGRVFREFAFTLSIAVLISLVVSLSTTPMMCARLIQPAAERKPGRLSRALEAGYGALLAAYRGSLGWALRHPLIVLMSLLVTVALNFHLFAVVPKGLFPQQDTRRLIGGIRADQSISFQMMRRKMNQLVSIIMKDSEVANVVAFTGSGQTNAGSVYVDLNSERKLNAALVVARLRHELQHVTGANLFLKSVQDFRVGGRQSNAQYQFTLESDDLAALHMWTPKLVEALRFVPELTDVDSDQQQGGLETKIAIDRATASRLGISASQIDNTLYDAFGQRQVSVIFNPLNQYHVVMEVAPTFWQSPDILQEVFISTSGGSVGGVQATNAVAGTTLSAASTSSLNAAMVASDSARNRATNSIASRGRGSTSTGSAVSTRVETMVPLAAFASFEPGNTSLAVNHQGLFPANTISFNLAPGRSLSDGVAAINRAVERIGMPAGIHGSFQGTARAFQQSLASEPFLILAAIVAVYIVLGILYESYVHPLTILSTLPSAGVGAVLALLATGVEFSIIALIGVILLIGIVKKNAIMMIDFALDGERHRGLSSRDAIREACLLRFRPIMMTTMAALLGALPLALGFGEGGELRRPLGISIVGGLIVSQFLTLYTTPVVYLYFDRLRLWTQRRWRRRHSDRLADAG